MDANMGCSSGLEFVGCLKFVSRSCPMRWRLSVYGLVIVFAHAHHQQVFENDASLSPVPLLARFRSLSRTECEPPQLYLG
jgi:hypothetical protein